MSRLTEIISLAWALYTDKVASGLLNPSNEKMMQLQLAQIFQTLAPLYESSTTESYKVLLEYPVAIEGETYIIDLVLQHSAGVKITRSAIELKCFRLLVNNGTKKRGAQNLGMYDYWADVQKIERFVSHGFESAYQFTITDDPYYVVTRHRGDQVAIYSTNRERVGVTGVLGQNIANRPGRIELRGTYGLPWITKGRFHFISQTAEADVSSPPST